MNNFDIIVAKGRQEKENLPEVEQNEMKRAKNHYGSLESRGRGKPYLMRISYNGQRFSKSSGETDRRKAEKALEEWAKTFQAKSEIEFWNNVAARSKTIADEENARQMNGNGITLDEIEAKYFETVAAQGATLAETTKTKNRGDLHHFVKWFKENTNVKFMKYVTAQQAVEFMDNRKKTVSPVAWNYQLRFYQRIYTVLKTEAKITVNPFKDISTQKQAQAGEYRETFTLSELSKVLEKSKGKNQRVYCGMLISAYCGLRVEDVANLTWGQIDLDRGTLWYTPLKTKRTIKKPIFLTFPDVLKEALEELKKESDSLFVFGSGKLKNKINFFNAHFKTICESLGFETHIKDDKGFSKSVITWHSLRHYFISYCLNVLHMRELDVMHLVGHTSLKMISTIYHHPDYNMLGDKLKQMQAPTFYEDKSNTKEAVNF